MTFLFSARHWRTIELGIKSLLLHKMRSALTMLGIIFGVCSVIAMLAIGEGASHEAQEAIKRLGSANIILRSVKPTADAAASRGARSYVSEYGLTYDDFERLGTTLPGVKRVLPLRILPEEIRHEETVVTAKLIGTLPLFAEFSHLDLVRGRFLADLDQQRAKNVCALSETLAAHLFPSEDPMDQLVRVQGDYYRVVGVVRETSAADKRPQGGGPAEGQSLNDNMYVPLATVRGRFGDTIIRRASGTYQAEKVELHEIIVQMQNTEAVEVAEQQIKTLLNRFHSEKDFEMVVPLQLLREAQKTKRMFNLVLGSIAAISLVVGGIGIMNIMLATVTERTREIGVRRALGARRRDIITQFVVETVVLSVGGGLIGVALGVTVPLIVSSLTELKTIITFWSLALSFGISGLVGVIFGLYPARRAASLDPIEALRHE
jgi:putative ABC transport system permease protein